MAGAGNKFATAVGWAVDDSNELKWKVFPRHPPQATSNATVAAQSTKTYAFSPNLGQANSSRGITGD